MDAAALADLTALDTARLVRERQLSAREVTEAALARIARLDPELRATTAVCTERALADADRLDSAGPTGPLAGVPVAVKAEIDLEGVVTTFGGRARTTPAAADAEVVRRLREAGAVVVAVTAMPELGQFPVTESVAFGATHNPWSPAHTPGGSSGGSAAAVASGMVPVALGGDGGGSIRIPASCCGIVGLKPQRGRVSTAPHPDLWGALGTCGPLTRTVADSALVYDVIGGSTPTDRWQAPVKESSWLDVATHDPRPLRVAWTTKSIAAGLPVDPQVTAAVEALAERVADLGHLVEHVEPRWPVPTQAFVTQFLAAVRDESRLVEHPERLEARTRQTVALGRAVTPALLRAAQRSGEKVAAGLDRVLGSYDLLLTPTMACLPPQIGLLDACGSLRAMARSMPMVEFTAICNVTGHPAASIPGGLSREGLPIGVQVVGRTGGEATILALAGQVERSNRWPRPPRLDV